jgi:ABC-type antimicrobial peptide transport system permease subunit
MQRPAFLAFIGADLVVRGREPAALADGIRARISALAADAPVRVRTLDERMASRTADRRFVLTLLAVFALLALVLTAVGIWGVISFIASRRTRDMGIRLALGARPAQVLRGLQREALPAVLVGMIAGAALAGTLIRLVRSQLYGVGVFDPVSLTVVAITMALTAWLASWVPARRVRSLDPAVTLRDP